jgi:hypothetical protein
LQQLSIEARVNGDGDNGMFATAVNANDGMVAVASTATVQLTMTTTIATAIIGQRRHPCQCHSIIVPSSQSRFY